MSFRDIHPVIIARDAAATIRATLDSLRDFDEVIVYDNGSKDDTLAICKTFANVRIECGAFFGFGPTKNHAASLASGDWILSLDADEYLDDALRETLRQLDLANARLAYALNRHNLLMGKHVSHGGWGNDWLVRLYHRSTCAYDDAPVHENVVVPENVEVIGLQGPLWHQAVTDVDQFLHKISRYSELRRGRAGRVKSPLACVAGAFWAFFKSYVLQRGFLEGWRGLIIANCNAQGSFFRHIKRYVDARTKQAR